MVFLRREFIWSWPAASMMQSCWGLVKVEQASPQVVAVVTVKADSSGVETGVATPNQKGQVGRALVAVVVIADACRHTPHSGYGRWWSCSDSPCIVQVPCDVGVPRRRVLA